MAILRLVDTVGINKHNGNIRCFAVIGFLYGTKQAQEFLWPKSNSKKYCFVIDWFAPAASL